MGAIDSEFAKNRENDACLIRFIALQQAIPHPKTCYGGHEQMQEHLPRGFRLSVYFVVMTFWPGDFVCDFPLGGFEILLNQHLPEASLGPSIGVGDSRSLLRFGKCRFTHNGFPCLN